MEKLLIITNLLSVGFDGQNIAQFEYTGKLYKKYTISTLRGNPPTLKR